MKRYLVGAVLLLALLACFSPAFGEEDPGCGYLWYVEEGELLYNDDGYYTGYSGDRLYISDDLGASYVELPGLYEASRNHWERYSDRSGFSHFPTEGCGWRPGAASATTGIIHKGR